MVPHSRRQAISCLLNSQTSVLTPVRYTGQNIRALRQESNSVAVKLRQRAERHPSVPDKVCKSLLVLRIEPAFSHKSSEVDLHGPKKPEQ